MNQHSAIRNSHSSFRRGLHTKIIAWSFVPTAIILVAVALVTFIAYQRVTEDLVIERDLELTRLSAGQFATDLAEYTDLLAALARNPVTYGHPAAQRVALQRARERLTVFDGGVIILNTFGTVVAAEPERPDVLGQNWSDRNYYRQMLRAPGAVFSDIVADGPHGTEVIVAAVPIISPQGEFLGTIAGMFRLGTTTVSALYGDIVKLRLGESGSLYLMDGNGRLIYHSEAEHIGEDFSAQAVAQQALNAQIGATRTRDLESRDIVASFAPVPGTTWNLVAEESWSALISPARGYQQFLLLLLMLGVMVPALVVAVGTRRITKPITELIAAAQAVAGGDFGHTIIAHTGDEVEELAEQFSLMSAQLQELYASLERRIADRTKELAALNAIATVVSRSLDLQEILNNALDKTLEVIGIEAGGIYLLDEATRVLALATQRGLSPQLVAEIDGLGVGEGFSGRVAQSGRPIVVTDISEDRRLTRTIVREAGFHSLASVPLSSRGMVLGTLFAVNYGYRDFTDQDVQLLTSIGHQIGVAIENAHLFEAERRRRQEATLLAEMAKLISGTLDLDEVLRLTAEYAIQVFDVHGCCVFLYNEATGTLRPATHIGFDDQVTGAIRSVEFTPSQKLFQTVFAGLQPLIVEDVPSDPHLSPQHLMDLQSVLVVPIEVGGHRLGAMQLGTQRPKQRRFTADEGELALALANQAAMAIENARLYEQAQQVATLEERQRLARDLHDSVTQELYGVTMYAEAGARLLSAGEMKLASEHLHEIRDTAQEALREMRLLIFELRPPVLEQEGLVVALQTRLEAVEDRSGLETGFSVDGESRLPPDIEEGLYRIAQEALNNVLKHAQAHRVTVCLRQDKRTVMLEVADDGIGFDPIIAREQAGLGLPGMEERAVGMGGRLTVESSPGEGTSVRVEVNL